MTILLAAAIAFGPLGPVRHVTLHDGGLRADLAYRIAHDREHDTGEAAASPSIAAGTLTFMLDGRQHVLDLGAVFPIFTDRITLSNDPLRDGCGVTRTLSRTQRYLAIQAVLAERGCAPIVAFVDLKSGSAVGQTIFDPAWNHRFDASPERFNGTRLRVLSIDRISMKRATWTTVGPSTVPWRFAVVRALAADGRLRLLAFDLDPDGFSPGNRAVETIPNVGSFIDLGTLSAPYPELPVRYFRNEPVVRLSVTDNERFAKMQTPTPPDVARIATRNSWFAHADYEARAGHFDDAVDALATMLRYESDPSLGEAEAKMLSRCRALRTRVRNGTVKSSAASASFSTGCSSASE